MMFVLGYMRLKYLESPCLLLTLQNWDHFSISYEVMTLFSGHGDSRYLTHVDMETAKPVRPAHPSTPKAQKLPCTRAQRP